MNFLSYFFTFWLVFTIIGFVRMVADKISPRIKDEYKMEPNKKEIIALLIIAAVAALVFALIFALMQNTSEEVILFARRLCL